METKVQFQKNATVLAADGEDVGSLDRVVLVPETKAVTHIVVRKGTLLNKVDRVVPINLVADTTEDQIVLRAEAGDLESFPPFEEEHFVEEKGDLDKPPSAESTSPSTFGFPEVDPPFLAVPGEKFISEVEQNIPEGTVALKEGAKVITAEGKHVGNVERVLAEPSVVDQVTHLLISTGMLLKKTKLIPIQWVAKMSENEVQLRVEADSVEKLADVSIAG
jgi:uncharacterized protein YrrD